MITLEDFMLRSPVLDVLVRPAPIIDDAPPPRPPCWAFWRRRAWRAKRAEWLAKYGYKHQLRTTLPPATWSKIT